MDNPLPLAVEAVQGVVNIPTIRKRLNRSIKCYRPLRCGKAYERYLATMVENGDSSQAALIEFAENPEDEDKETKK